VRCSRRREIVKRKESNNRRGERETEGRGGEKRERRSIMGRWKKKCKTEERREAERKKKVREAMMRKGKRDGKEKEKKERRE
jgi:hypothetical protein